MCSMIYFSFKYFLNDAINTEENKRVSEYPNVSEYTSPLKSDITLQNTIVDIRQADIDKTVHNSFNAFIIQYFFLMG